MTPNGNPSGTFCVVIESQIAVATCPLPKGTCMWKHSVHGRCTYDEEFANSSFTATEFAARVGKKVIEPEIVGIIRRSLVHKIKEELAT